MNPTELIQELQRLGVELRADGDRLRFKPASAVPPELRARLSECKSAILAELTSKRSHEPPLTVLSNSGWSPRSWRDRLQQLADLCEAIQPALATKYRSEAESLTAAIGENHANS